LLPAHRAPRGPGLVRTRKAILAETTTPAELLARLDALHERLGRLELQQQGLGSLGAALEAELAVQRSDLRKSGTRLHELEHQILPPPVKLPLDRFRGSEAEVRVRQSQYVSVFAGQRDVIDLGCGRGEFLDLLRDAGIEARGVDIDAELVRRCRDRDLAVDQADALSFLADSTPASFGGIFAAQLIEHLPTIDVARLIALAGTRLRGGGVLVLETVNPQCLTGLTSFWIDPTHRQPVHPELLCWLFEQHGFARPRVVTSVPSDASLAVPPLRYTPGDADIEAFNAGIQRVNQALFGGQAYAVVAHRPA
jgi:SAM-dependent methyltransferase